MNLHRFRFPVVTILFSALASGCVSVHRIQIDAPGQSSRSVEGGPYRIVELRFRNVGLSGAFGQETKSSGKELSKILSEESPGLFSDDAGATPIIVRQTTTDLLLDGVPEKVDWNTRTILGGFAFVFSLGFYPCEYTGDYSFQTEIQLADEEYSTPFRWEARCRDLSMNFVAGAFYPESSGWKRGDSRLAYMEERRIALRKAKRIELSKTASDEERESARESLLWNSGYQLNPETLKRGTALGIVGALGRLTPEQRQSVRDNPIAWHLAGKADGKIPKKRNKRSGTAGK